MMAQAASACPGHRVIAASPGVRARRRELTVSSPQPCLGADCHKGAMPCLPSSARHREDVKTLGGNCHLLPEVSPGSRVVSSHSGKSAFAAHQLHCVLQEFKYPTFGLILSRGQQREREKPVLQGRWIQAKLIWGAGLSTSISFSTTRTACRQVSNIFLSPKSLLESAMSLSYHLWPF